MRVPADFDRYKSDGRVIDIDVNDPSINQIGEPQDTPTAQRFADWLRSNGWTVSTAHRGEMRIGGLTVSQDTSVAACALDLLDECSGVGNRMY